MPMAHNGLAKLAEELGELQQVVGKMLAYGTGEHPDGKGNLLQRFQEESADVVAAISFVSELHGVDADEVQERILKKLRTFNSWHKDELS